MDYRTKANGKVWDSVAAKHFETYHVQKVLDHTPVINDLIRNEVGDVEGKSLLHLLCHIGTDTLSWRLLGANATGIDISEESINYARRLSNAAQIDANFMVSDVMDLRPTQKYDIVFASTGVLCWIPNIDRFAEIVQKCMNDEGFFYLHDGHPFINMIGKGDNGTGIVSDYFFKNVGAYDSFTDYTDPSFIVKEKSYEWNWTVGDVINAFCKAGLKIEYFREYPNFFYYGYPGEVSTDRTEQYPCTFSMKARLK